MSRNDFCSLLLPSRVRKRLRENGIDEVNDLLAAGPPFMDDIQMVMARLHLSRVFTHRSASFLSDPTREPIPTWMPSFDALLDGGIHRRKITEVTGAPGSGKTQFCLQVAASNWLLKRSTIYIDLKGGFSKKRFEEVASEMGKMQACRSISATGTPDFHLKLCGSWKELIALAVLLPGFVSASRSANPVTLVIMDGFDHHLRHGLHDLPLRRKVTAKLTQKLVEIARTGAAVLVTNQLSVKPTNVSTGLTQVPALGRMFGHECAYRFTLSLRDGVREAKFFKSPTFGHAVVRFNICRKGCTEEADALT